MTNLLGLVNMLGNAGQDAWMKANPWFGQLVNAINWAVIPIMIIALSAGSIYAIILGVNLARAETSDKREEAKKRIIWCIIGIVSIVVLILVLELVVKQLPQILGRTPAEEPEIDDGIYFISCITNTIKYYVPALR